MNNNFIQTDISLIPDDWNSVSISEVSKFSRGISWRKTEEDPSGSLVISIPNIGDRKIDYKSKYNHYIKKNISHAKRLNVGDIIFVGSSGSIHNIGRNALVKYLPFGIIAFASFTFKAETFKDKVDNEFFYYLVKSPFVPFEQYTKRASDGKFNFQLRDFQKNLIIPLPPLPEQKKIAHVLSKIQQAIETQQEIIKTTQELKKALMQKLFTEGLNPDSSGQKQTEIGLIPESWEVQIMSNLLEKTNTRNPSSEHPDKLIKYIDVSSVSNEFFSVIDYQYIKGSAAPSRARKVVQLNDIIFATVRPTLKRIAKIDYHFNNEYCSTAFCVLRTIQNQLNHNFLYYYLQTDGFIQRISKHQYGASYPAVRDDDVKRIKIPKPSKKEQENISQIFISIDLSIAILNKKKALYTDLFNTSLNQLMSGQTRVKDIEFNIEESLEELQS